MAETYLQALERRNRFTWLLAVTGAIFINCILFVIMPMLLGRNSAVPRISEVVPEVTVVRLPAVKRQRQQKQERVEQVQKVPESTAFHMKTPPMVKPRLSPLPFQIDSDFMPAMDGLENLPIDTRFAQGLKLDGVFSMGDLDARPSLQVRIPPVYPLRARERRIEGWVRVRILVGIDGDVEKADIVEARPPGYFERSVLQAVRRWRFSPPTISGEPVKAWMVTKIRFRLEK